LSVEPSAVPVTSSEEQSAVPVTSSEEQSAVPVPPLVSSSVEDEEALSTMIEPAAPVSPIASIDEIDALASTGTSASECDSSPFKVLWSYLLIMCPSYFVERKNIRWTESLTALLVDEVAKRVTVPGLCTPSMRNLTAEGWEQVISAMLPSAPGLQKATAIAKWGKLQSSFGTLMEYETWLSRDASGLGAPQLHETPMAFLDRIDKEAPQCMHPLAVMCFPCTFKRIAMSPCRFKLY
jgi:hypothetical protein